MKYNKVYVCNYGRRKPHAYAATAQINMGVFEQIHHNKHYLALIAYILRKYKTWMCNHQQVLSCGL